jgi:hypothetical protein
MASRIWKPEGQVGVRPTGGGLGLVVQLGGNSVGIADGKDVTMDVASVEGLVLSDDADDGVLEEHEETVATKATVTSPASRTQR